MTPSRRSSTASDLSVLASNLGRPNCYGVPDDPVHCTRQTWYCNLNQQGGIDASDLSSFVADFYSSYHKRCELTKVDPGDELAAASNWFGIAPTGRNSTDWGREIPGYDVVDWGRLRRAIADPYGYRTQLMGAGKAPWGQAKMLYR